ncbi:MAG: hypothetical protein HYS32_01935 [Candidatus Woesearchaeota archaeon]|nr:MAG: hypothetical protein HYS32_01935 [Candidatus Woesearchaeota archaeon]
MVDWNVFKKRAKSKSDFEEEELKFRQKRARKARGFDIGTYDELRTASANVAKAKEVLADFSRFLPDRKGIRQLKSKPRSGLGIQVNISRDIIGRLSELHSSFDSFLGIIGSVKQKVDEMGKKEEYGPPLSRLEKDIKEKLKAANTLFSTILKEVSKNNADLNADWGEVVNCRAGLSEAYTEIISLINKVIDLDRRITSDYAKWGPK